MNKAVKEFNRLLKKNKITAYQFCKDTGVPQATVSAWRAGLRNPSLSKLIVVADYFGVDIKTFI